MSPAASVRPAAGLTRPPPGDLLALALAVAAVSTSAPLIREADAPALSIAFWRNALACVPVWGWVLWRRRSELAATTSRERRLAVVAGVLLGAHFATWIPSLSYTSVASSVALVATQPVWAALLARASGVDVPRRAWLGIVVAVLGTATLSGVDLSLSARALFGDLLALAGGILAAAYVTAGADARRTMGTGVYTAICYSVAAAVLAGACLVGGRPLGGFDARTWWLLMALTVGPQLLGHSVINRVLRTTTPTLASVAILFEIVGATFLAWAWFGERPPAGAYPAAVLIAAGVVVVLRASRVVTPPPPD